MAEATEETVGSEKENKTEVSQPELTKKRSLEIGETQAKSAEAGAVKKSREVKDVEGAAATEQESKTEEATTESNATSEPAKEKKESDDAPSGLKLAWADSSTGFGSFAAKDGSTAFGSVGQQKNVFETATNEPIFGSAVSKDSEESTTKEPAAEELVFGQKTGTEDTKAEEDEIPTGEENEICIYRIRARLFRLSEVEVVENKVDSEKLQLGEDAGEASSPKVVVKKMQWSEMGAGTIRVNKPKEKGTARLVMRREGVFKLLLNAPVWPSMPVEKASDKALRIICTSHTSASDDSPKPESFLLRLSRKDDCEDLFAAINRARSL